MAGTSPAMTFREKNLSSIITLGAGALAALYLISAPLAMLLVAAFRGPDDMLPFEQGAVWTLDNLVAVYGDRALYTLSHIQITEPTRQAQKAYAL
jgi:ABC-type spermidine/putrescine transport system permease subunit II